MKQHLHPGARWIFRWYGIRVFLPILVFLIFFIIAGVQSLTPSPLETITGAVIGAAGFVVLLVIIGLIEVYTRMSYNRYLYEFVSDGVHIEQGIIWKKYTTIPYERVQNVEIRRGILARVFGFSTLDIETAGRSGFQVQWGRGSREYRAEGHLPALSIEGAEQAREFLLKKIQRRGRGKEDSGV